MVQSLLQSLCCNQMAGGNSLALAVRLASVLNLNMLKRFLSVHAQVVRK